MNKIYIGLALLAIIQFGLIYANLKIDIEVVKVINWWFVSIPSIIVILAILGLFVFSKIINIQ